MFWVYTSMTLLMLLGMFLIFIILLQRGRGGGLAGAFGGMGGQSAFGTKAGDVFTKITVVVALIWVLLAATSGFALRGAASGRYEGGGEAPAEQGAIESGEEQPADAATDGSAAKTEGGVPSELGLTGEEEPSADTKAPQTESPTQSGSEKTPPEPQNSNSSEKTE